LLGLANIDDDVPVESTYYEFRKLLGIHQEQTGEDLLKVTFQQITTRQVTYYEVSGKKIRLDSKLINSNIAKSNRLSLITEVLRKHLQDISDSDLQENFKGNTLQILVDLKKQSTSNFTYPLTSPEKKTMLVTLGGIIQKLLKLKLGSGASFGLLERVYQEQYEELSGDNEDENPDKKTTVPNNVIPKKPKQIPSSSLQSAHDPQATYRTKGQGASKQNVSGYHVNITESCTPDDGLNLILDVQTVTANVCEDQFLLDAIAQSEQVLRQENRGTASQNKIEEVITDGGYDSVTNRESMLQQDQPIWSIAKMKGAKHIYEITKDDQQNIKVSNKKSGRELEINYSEKANKYVIKNENGTKRYMTKQAIENYINHQEITSQVNEESYNLRASVESTIHQSFHRLKKRNKVVYRGLIKCHWYAISRAFWVNLVRIVAKMAGKQLQLMILALQSIIIHHKTIKWTEFHIMKNNTLVYSK